MEGRNGSMEIQKGETMENEVKKVLDDHEERLTKLEEIFLIEKKSTDINKTKYKGLVGGIKFLIKNGFLNEPKTVEEIKNELESKGYFYSYVSVDKILRVDLINKKILNRIRKNDIWKYVIRK